MADIVRYINTNSTPGGDGTTNATTGANRAYASATEWEAAEATDLVTAGNTHTVYASGTVADDHVQLSGWTTDATHNINFIGNNFTGKIDATLFRFVSTTATCFDNRQDGTFIQGVPMQGDDPSNYANALSTLNSIRIDACILLRTINSGIQPRGFYSNGVISIITNCIAYGWNGGSSGGESFHALNNASVLILNSLSDSADTYGFYGHLGSVINCIAISTAGTDYTAATIAQCWAETTATANYALSATLTDEFTDYVNNDYAPPATASYIDQGSDQSAYTTTDILGTARPQNSVFDVGPYEYIAGGTPISKTFTHNIESAGYLAVTKQALIESVKSMQTGHSATVESLQQISASKQHAIESGQGVDASKVIDIESLGNVSINVSGNLESLQRANNLYQQYFECLSGVANNFTEQFECKGSAAVSANFVMPIEQSGYLSSIFSADIESLESIAAEGIISVEAMQTIANTISLNIESIGVVQQGISATIECIAAISAETVVEFEGLQSISGIGTFSLEVLQEISKQTGIPIEAIQDASLNVVINVIEKTAYFNIVLNKQITFATVIDKSITFN